MSAVASRAGRFRSGAALRVFAVAIVALAGCAAPSPTPELPAGSGAPNLWAGRFAVTVTEGGFQPREERSSGRFSLRTSGERRQLELSSPLGQTLARVTLDSGAATLVASDGRTYEAASAEALTEQVFGWRLPIGNLPRWLEGRIEQPTEHDAGRVVAGREQNWSIRFESFEGERPRRLMLEWPADGGDATRRLELRLVVDSALHVARVGASN